jgi:acetyltransferase-like isoleucine patch superfamily enzyme
MNFKVPFQQIIAVIISKIIEKYITKPFCSTFAYIALWGWGAKTKGNLEVLGFMRLHIEGKLTLGENVRINSKRNNYVGIDRRMSVYVGPEGILEIGDGCGLSNSTIVCLKSVRILSGTFIGGGCGIYDTDFHQLSASDRLENSGDIPAGEIVIGPNAFVGGHVIILKGVTVGQGAVIGAGSVVTKSIPPNEIWAGVPAKFVRKL